MLNSHEQNKFNINGTFGANASSKGMLYKWTAYLNGKLVYIKTGVKYRNTYSDIQPLTEVLVSQILDSLKVNHVKYYYDKMNRNNKIYDVCYSFDFAEGYKYTTIRELVGTNNSDLYTHLINNLYLDKKELDTMIIVDFLINNIDRHLRNFGMLQDEHGTLKFAPLFDHGFALYGNIIDEELELDSPEFLESIDECKPFKSSHYEQIGLISDISFKINTNEILEIVDSYKKYLKPHRLECIKYLLKIRIEYLKERGILYE
ncbi:HipA domain-containing protein [Clostridioides sp. ES-S-0048-02]|uniref:HipA domain-containing protein n=1 Tax=Clostridioides sp. ES-S-0048-02 TaxID=2770777 RepID=UPI001D1306DB|nr:HipA domain-containing protein [Clostridioides sp. ES-S-0048-02]